ncbi:MAG: hypothetical protein CL949_09485 [Erythrobacter sp.]|nr:hypothetical protein [Erythrobacter sp.]
MSATSTLLVSRNAALLALAKLEIGDLSDTEIESRLDKHFVKKADGSDARYNVSITTWDEDEKLDDDAELMWAVR